MQYDLVRQREWLFLDAARSVVMADGLYLFDDGSKSKTEGNSMSKTNVRLVASGVSDVLQFVVGVGVVPVGYSYRYKRGYVVGVQIPAYVEIITK